MVSIYNLTKFCHASVIPQVRTYTRYGTGSVVMFDYAESPLCPAGRFRISELTSNVPYAVRSTLRNDGFGLLGKTRISKKQLHYCI